MKSIVEPDFNLLFDPGSIALIGASNNIGKWGAIVFLNIVLGGYRGKLYPVNPKEETILGHKAYANVNQIPDPVDLAIIAIPAHLTKGAVQITQMNADFPAAKRHKRRKIFYTNSTN